MADGGGRVRTNGEEARDRQLVEGREQRAAEVALLLAQRLESMERSTRGVADLEEKVVELTLLVADASAAVRADLVETHKAALASQAELERLRAKAVEVEKTLNEVTQAGLEFTALKAKVKEIEAAGALNADRALNAHKMMEGFGEMVEKVLAAFNLFAEMSDKYTSAHAQEGERARVDKWIRSRR